MAKDLREQLQQTLGAAYTLERELGGGGMSRVFVARETALGRTVVVKVLSPELAAGLNVERFRREIQLAAQLQHAHIVPVLAAGETEGLPYYTMPFVEGESLRGQVAQGPLPVGLVLSYLRDVARALAYAHARGVVHRDIKPDNVLVAGGSAVVTDFGVAKALSSARGDAPGGTLTHVGTSLGTPAYMAPEQVAADPDTNHRADLYAFGAMAYELLAGRSPFGGRSPHKMLAAQMSERPEPIEQLRPDTPPRLAAVIMRCLEKDPGDRPQSADEVLRDLDASVSSDSSSAAPAIALATRRTLVRALVIYAVAFVMVAIVARAAIIAIGLPDWVFPGALIVMALGLPVILFTALVQRQSRLALAAGRTTPGGTATAHSTVTRIAVKAQPHISWRRTAWGGAVAVGAFVLLVGGYMAMRLLGIGPAGTLSASGVFGSRERVVVADFQSPVGDSTLGPVVTEALRTDLAQSPNLQVLDPARIRDALQRMQVSPDSRLDLALARDLATREGVKAVVDGAILGIGGSYVVTARLVEASSGATLVSFRETADDGRGLLPAIGRVSKALRAKVGESLKSVRAAAPLEAVTTASLPALRKYAEGDHVMGVTGDNVRAEALFREAIALDTGFAMAWRKLGILLGNTQGAYAEQVNALTHAFNHRDRLGIIERNLAAGSYYSQVEDRADDAIAAYEAILAVDSLNFTALNNAAILYQQQGNPRKAATYLRRAINGGFDAFNGYSNLAVAEFRLGDTAAARAAADSLAARYPSHPENQIVRTWLAFGVGQYDSADAHARRLAAMSAGDPSNLGTALMMRSAVAETQGHLDASAALADEWAAARASPALPELPLQAAAYGALDDIWYRNDRAAGLARMDRALREHPLRGIPVVQRPYRLLAEVYARAGDVARARQYLSEMATELPPEVRSNAENDPHPVLGLIAMAERRPADAVTQFASARRSIFCELCSVPDLARAYDAAGQPDSAIAAYRRYVDTPDPFRWVTDGMALAPAEKRLGELYVARGDTARAITAYARFVSLWKNADPGLQPQVAAVRQRLDGLSRREVAPR